MEMWSVPCLCTFFLVSGVLSEPLIPRQIIMTGKPESLEEMPDEVQENVKHTLALADSDMKFRWFGDQACHDYIKRHYDYELLFLFDQADPGFYRGDICRAAVLYQEGGFYADVDVELAVPLESIVDDNTTFASAFSISGDVFNGIIAVVPKSAILSETLKEIRNWYFGDGPHVGNSLMGTQTMFRGMERAVSVACEVDDLKSEKHTFSWQCGQHVIKMYEEKPLNCYPDSGDPEIWRQECPAERQGTPKYAIGMRLGLFPAGQALFPGRKIIGWPRYSSCRMYDGCGSGGHKYIDDPGESDEPSPGLGELMQTAKETIWAVGRRVVEQVGSLGGSFIHWPRASESPRASTPSSTPAGDDPGSHAQEYQKYTKLARRSAKVHQPNQQSLQVDGAATFLSTAHMK